MFKETTEKTCEISLAKVLCEELKHIRQDTIPDSSKTCENETGEKLDDVFNDFHRAKFSALCFSGGGIRSATFGLGVVQALAKHNLLDKFDYLSTVSGGGYMGTWLSAWIRREQINSFEEKVVGLEEMLKTGNQDSAGDSAEIDDDAILNEARGENQALFNKYNAVQDKGVTEVQDKLNRQVITDATCPNPEPNQLQHLRVYSNYMSPKVGLLSADTWTLLAIYIRNLILNWTIFIPLISAILLIPKILHSFLSTETANDWYPIILMLFALFGGSFAVAFMVNKLPSKNLDTLKVKHDNDSWVLALGVLPLIVLAFAATTFWFWHQRFNPVLPDSLEYFRPFLAYEWLDIIFFSISIFVIGYLLFDVTKRPRVKLDYKGISMATISSAVGGVLLWLTAKKLFVLNDFSDNSISYYLCFAVPVYLLVLSISSTIFVGLSSMFVTDDDREWLARFGGWLMIACVGWSVLNIAALFGPQWFEYLAFSAKKLFYADKLSPNDFYNSLISIIAAVSGFLSLVGGFSGESKVRKEPRESRLSKFLAIAPKIAAVVFLAFLLVALAYLLNFALDTFKDYLRQTESAWLTNTTVKLNLLSQTSVDYYLLWLLFLAAIGIVMACFVNINKFSLHGAYRDRLIRAYLGASHVNRKGNLFTGFDDADNFQLHRLKGQKPFHVFNATLNLIDGKNLAWQNRKAATFTMSPLHCGSWLLGYRYTNEYSRNTNLKKCASLRYCNKLGACCADVEHCELPGKALRVGTAMAISGAAANPNMGYYSSPVVAFLMALFNIRLGWWLGNTGKIGDRKDSWGTAFYTKSSPSIAVLPLINETFGRTDENKRYLNITDGGHFENLGLYEMVLRRCKIIFLSDAAADEKFKFSEISNAIGKCKVDLGVEIKFKDGINIFARNVAKDHLMDRKRFAIAEIVYPEKDSAGNNFKGTLLYLRPAVYGDEPTDVEYYAKANEAFPHQSTGDQMYDEKQFEAYRALGFYTMNEILSTQPTAEIVNLLNILRGSETR